MAILMLWGHAAYTQHALDSMELNQKQWEAVRDFYAVEAIKLLARLDTLNYQIDSLKPLRDIAVSYDCEAELYKIVGATKEQVADFRKKFEETEKKISTKLGTPDELRKYYFEEIKNSKIKCLPEFSDRYLSMLNYMNASFTSTEDKKEYPSDSYSVVKGDCLWKISRQKYNTPYLWPAIWDANKISILNPDYFPESEKKSLSDPNLIYPGQVLKIPAMPKEDPEKRSERIKKMKKFRKKL
jgi:LysM repeat protein